MQKEINNDITQSAQKLRLLAESGKQTKWATFPFRGYKNIHILESQTALLSAYIDSVRKNGLNSSTLICNSNKQAADATRILRPVFGHNTPYLEQGDLLLVTQNNLLTGLMNGDLVVVVRVGKAEQRAGLTFLDVTVREQFTGVEYTQLLILDVLSNKATNISQPQQRGLLLDFYYRMKEKGVKQHTGEFNVAMAHDPYLNALRTVYGYSLTCHKSQGGEWDYVFLDIPRYLSGQEKPYVYQWVYTAMTRARRELYVVHDFWVK